jgi:hypothetical protein
MKKRILFAILVCSILFSCKKEESQFQTSTHLNYYEVFPNLNEERINQDLEGIRSIKRLKITYSDISDLSFLNNIESVNEIFIDHCPNIQSIEVITRIDNIERLSIWDCHGLTSIEGLENLDSLNYLELWSNDNVTDITFSNLRKINGKITIITSPKLKEINFPELLHTESLEIKGNRKLHSINCPKLNSVENELNISSNADLTQLGNWQNLEYVGRVGITNNTKLQSVDAINHIYINSFLMMWGNPIDDYCVLKDIVLQNDDLGINIRLSNGANCDYFYFEECE